MQTVAITNSKGGVGKTTTAVNLSMGLARKGKRVLLVDLDNNQHASRWLLGQERLDGVGQGGLPEVLRSGEVCEEDVLVSNDSPLLRVCPSTPLLQRAEMLLVNEIARERRLADALKGVRADFDYVVLDTPPNMGILTLNALCAADATIVPLTPAFMSLSGLKQANSALLETQKKLGSKAHLLGYLLTQVDARTSERDSVAEEVGEEFRGALLFKSQVRISVDAVRLPRTGRTVWDAGADRRGAEDYPPVMDEMLKRWKGART